MSTAAPAADVVGTPDPPRPVTPVGVLAAALERVAGGLEATPDLDPALVADLAVARELATGLEPYLSRWTTPESPALSLIAQRTAVEDWSRPAGGQGLEQEMLSGHVEGQFLKMLVRLTHAHQVLEIGMFTGYATLAMAEALPADGVVIACEIDSRAADLARQCFRASPDGHKVDVRVAPALRTLDELAARGCSFDLIFIDADKGAYVDYLATVLDSDLLAPNGVLCADNTLLQGEPWLAGGPSTNGAGIIAFNRAVAEDPRIEQVIVPLRDGLTLIRRVDDPR